MLLLMATYGMGAAEALSLEIDDFNWKLKTLRVRRSKTAVVIELPLLPIVARAVIAYLKAERPPAANTRQILLRTSMPYGSMTSSAIRHRIRFPVVHEQ
jgi:integrase